MMFCFGLSTLGAQQTQIFAPTDDAYIQNGSGNNNNILRVDPGSRVSYLKFDMSSYVGSVNSMTAKFTVNGDSGNGDVRFYSSTSTNWTENNLSSSNDPPLSNLVSTISGTHNINDTYSIDVTGINTNNGVFSIIIIMQNGGNDFAFASKENSNTSARPQLIITGDCTSQGTPCDDDDPCTINDVLDNDCNCFGQFNDSDNDGICDILNQCLFDASSPDNPDIDIDFSHERGYYTSPFNLAISSDDPTATIRFTTNGRQPTTTTGTLYNGPISINTTTVVKALAFSSADTTRVEGHTYVYIDDVIDQPNQVSGFPAATGLSTSIKDNGTLGPMLDDALTSIPFMSMSLDLDDYNFIYNTSSTPKQAHIEFFDQVENDSYDRSTGVSTYGNTSFNNPNADKKNYRFRFRQEFGASKFEFPLFGEDGAEDFDVFDLRAGGQVTTDLGGVQNMHEKIIKDAQIRMSGNGVHGRFVHLFINSVYWGVYTLSERPARAFGESYFGGDKDDYNTMKGTCCQDVALPIDGTDDSYDFMKTQLGNYPNIEHLIDVDHFIDYVMLCNYGPHGDWRTWNTYAIDNPTAGVPYRFFIWDVEPSFDNDWYFTDFLVDTRSHEDIWQPLKAHEDFRMRVADHFECNCEEDAGDLNPTNFEAYYDQVFQENKLAYLAETARWGNRVLYEDFLDYRDHLINSGWFFNRKNDMKQAYENEDLYPSNVNAVNYNSDGGIVANGHQIVLNNPNSSGTIYYTLDGSDPRDPGGAVSGSATSYSGPFNLNQGVFELKARVLRNGNWSAMCPRTYYVDQNYSSLVINEIHYNPNDCDIVFDNISGRNFEFLEIKNCGSTPVNLMDVYFDRGITLDFDYSFELQPGDFYVLAEDAEFFELKYGFVPDDVYQGKLSNSGENLWLLDPEGGIADTLRYNDNPPWPSTADRGFFSLALMDCNLDNALAESWGIQSIFTTPGEENNFTDFGEHSFSGLIINEIHYNPLDSVDTATGDTINGRKFEFIELVNISPLPIDVTDYVFTRGIDYEFPPGTIIQPDQYIVLAEDRSSFRDRYGFDAFDKYDGQLSNSGETLWLTNGATGVLIDAVTYDDEFPWDTNADGGFTDFSLALIDPIVDNDTRLNWRVQCDKIFTPGQPNDLGCFPGYSYDGLTFTEIHYAPSGGNAFEFLELHNNSTAIIDLLELRISNAVTYQFESNFLFPNQYLILARDSALFENTYNITPHGEFTGGLNSNGETLLLKDLFGVTIDSVSYSNSAPWPTEPLQGVRSLALIDSDLDNSQGENWCVQETPPISPRTTNNFADTDNDSIADCVDTCPGLDDGLIGTSCDDGDPCTDKSVYTNCNCEAVQNFALTGTASMSSTLGNSNASNLIDGVVNNSNSELAHTTGNTPTDWVEVDLGSVQPITTVAISNRISCCTERLSNSYLLIADTPFPGNTDVTLALSNADFIHSIHDAAGIPIIAIDINVSGRYVRIQKSGLDLVNTPLNLRELEVFGLETTIADADADGVCDGLDQCAGLDDALIGTACEDGDPCTIGETFNANCQCIGGTTGDEDADGICDALDECPGFDNALIGQACDDGDPCTTGETYDANCGCSDGVFIDSDGDNVCDVNDQCPGINDSLIGQACDDGNPCTTGDTYDLVCHCQGIQSGDQDNDGVCDVLDQCPGFDNNLIGTPCDDGILCFIGSTWDSNCNCTGGFFSDLDNDNVCDPLDQCPGYDDNVDVNGNGIPDGCEGCPDYINEHSQNTITIDRRANIKLSTNGWVPANADIEYQAGETVELLPHFEVRTGAVFHAYISPCN